MHFAYDFCYNCYAALPSVRAEERAQLFYLSARAHAACRHSTAAACRLGLGDEVDRAASHTLLVVPFTYLIRPVESRG